MRFESPLVRATLVRRYKRFFADVTLDNGTPAVAHVANTGAMTGLANPGATVWLAPNTSPTAKLPWRWNLTELRHNDAPLYVGINTAWPNRVAEEAIRENRIPQLANYTSLRREVAYHDNSRIDLLLEDTPDTPDSTGAPAQTSTTAARPPCYVEVKNVHLAHGATALFPDAVTTRGSKHLAALTAMVAAGARAVQLFVIQRADVATFAPAWHIDPTYATALVNAHKSGVEIYAWVASVTLTDITLSHPIPIDLTQPPTHKAPSQKPAPVKPARSSKRATPQR